METRRQPRHRLLLGALALLAACASFALEPSQVPGESQQPRQAQQPRRAADATTQTDAADRSDPDDTRSYADVTHEQRIVTLRGRQFTLHLYRPANASAAVPAIYACGDGGWRLLAPRTAEQLAHGGAAVVGVDSKAYLHAYASAAQPLTVEQIARDYAELAPVARDYAKAGREAPVYVYGWSLGAGFALAAGSVPELRENWAGIVAIGLTPQNQLAAGVDGDVVDLTRPQNRGLGFRSDVVIAKLAPLPLVMIQSSRDQFVPVAAGRELFGRAAEPKRFVVIDAHNHRFSGGRDDFYKALSDAATWINSRRGAA